MKKLSKILGNLWGWLMVALWVVTATLAPIAIIVLCIRAIFGG